jgi:hypothetical protein
LDTADGTEYFKAIAQDAVPSPLPHKPDLLILPTRGAPVPALGGLFVDVHIPHWWGSTESTQRQASSTPLARVESAWHTKHTSQYRGWVGSRDGYDLLSGTISTGGSAHPDFLRWLRKCCRWAARKKVMSPREQEALNAAFTQRIMATLSVTLQKGVAETRRSCLNLMPIGDTNAKQGPVRHWEVATHPMPPADSASEDEAPA